MHILAIDTSSGVSALCLIRATADGDLELAIAEDDVDAAGKHAESLLPRVKALLAGAGMTLAQVELIGVGVGPGSFTGLRVGLATAKGLAFAAQLPIRGVCSLRALARGALALAAPAPAADATVIALTDAHRGEVFCAAYRQGVAGHLEELFAPFHAEPAAAIARLAPVAAGARVCGDGALRHPELGEALRGWTSHPIDHQGIAGRHVAVEAARAFALEGASDLASLVPLYLRDSDAQLPQTPLAT